MSASDVQVRIEWKGKEGGSHALASAATTEQAGCLERVVTADRLFALAGRSAQPVGWSVERGRMIVLVGDERYFISAEEWGGYLEWPEESLVRPASHFAREFGEVERLLQAFHGCLCEQDREDMVRAMAGKVLALKEAVLRAEEIWRGAGEFGQDGQDLQEAHRLKAYATEVQS